MRIYQEIIYDYTGSALRNLFKITDFFLDQFGKKDNVNIAIFIVLYLFKAKAHEIINDLRSLKATKKLNEAINGKLGLFHHSIFQQDIKPKLKGFVIFSPTHSSQAVIFDHFYIIFIPCLFRLLTNLLK